MTWKTPHAIQNLKDELNAMLDEEYILKYTDPVKSAERLKELEIMIQDYHQAISTLRKA